LKASKQDDFADPQSQAIRVANSVTPSEGYRPHLIQTWSDLYGVGYEGNYDGRTTTVIPATNFQHQFFGLRSAQSQVSQAPSVLWTSDQSLYGTGTGGGDYTPVAGSPLSGRVMRGNSDVDWRGAARRTGGAAGAIDSTAAGVVSLVPAGSRSLQAAGAAVVAIGLSLLAAASGLSVRATGPAGVTIRLALGPANAGHRHATPPALVNWGAVIPPARAVQRLASASTSISDRPATSLLPAGGTLQMNPGMGVLFPDRPLAGIITLPIPPDYRTLLVN
jgi:hypothetical protein